MSAMATLDDFSRLVAAVYSSVLGPENWNETLSDLQRTLDTHCALIRVDETGRSIQAASLARMRAPITSGITAGSTTCSRPSNTAP